MFGLTAKERLAKMQQKGGKAPEPGKGVGGQNPVPGKVNAGPGLLKNPEPPKTPVVDPKKPVTQQPANPQEPVKPKEEPKPVAAPEPAKPVPAPEPAKPKEPVKPKEEPKPVAAPEPAKPKEEPKKPAAAPESVKPTSAPEPVKPKEEPKKPAETAPEPVKPKEEPKKPAATAPEPVKPKEEPKKSEPVKPKEEPKKSEPVKPKEEPKKSEPVKPKEEPKKPEPAKAIESPKEPGKPVAKPNDDFFRGIFYFSGMGTLVGSALAEGVYVPEKAQRNAVDTDEIEASYERQRLRRGEEIIATARSQAQGLSTDFRHLQALLESLPTFTEVLEPQPLDRRAVDQVIHGHVYFQQEQHPVPFQTRAAHHGPEHPPPPPQPPAAAETQSHQAPIAKHPGAGAIAALPPAAAFDQKHSSAAIRSEVPGSFAAAIDEFDRVSATAQQPVFGAPPEARESPRPHRRERPIAGSDTPAASAASAASAAAADKAAGGARPYYGVPTTTGQAESPASAWQDRYGQAEVAKFQAPRPFSAAAAAGEIDSKGVKSWQLSHLRTLEAKGYQIVAESDGDVVKSYAPYLVSDRSQGVDRQRALHPNFESIAPRSPAFKSPAQPSTFAAAADLPYCDL